MFLTKLSFMYKLSLDWIFTLKFLLSIVESTARKLEEGAATPEQLNEVYQLESKIGQSSKEAIKAFTDAICIFRGE